MENGCDLLDWLGPDTSACVFRHLDDPADLVRASSVSRSWNKFVISNSFTKDLSVRLCPEVLNLESNSENLHQIYARLLQNLVSNKETKSNCISKCIWASSIDRFPDELIEVTLEDKRFSYWSTKRKEDSDKSENLTYRLVSDLCILDEIKIQSFHAFRNGDPIYSAKFVCFKIGCSKINQNLANNYDDFVWIYTSPKFPMQQENMLQTFRLPRPVLCIGGIVLIEFIGRAQRSYILNLDYICVSHVEVIGRPVSRLALSRLVSDPAAEGSLIKYSISEAEIDK